MLYYQDTNRQVRKKVNGYVFYVLLLDNGWYYKGYTSQFFYRMMQHFGRIGGCKTTKRHRPLSIIYYEVYKTKSEAIKREREMKYWGSRIEIQRLSNNFRQICLEQKLSH